MMGQAWVSSGNRIRSMGQLSVIDILHRHKEQGCSRQRQTDRHRERERRRRIRTRIQLLHTDKQTDTGRERGRIKDKNIAFTRRQITGEGEREDKGQGFLSKSRLFFFFFFFLARQSDGKEERERRRMKKKQGKNAHTQKREEKNVKQPARRFVSV